MLVSWSMLIRRIAVLTGAAVLAVGCAKGPAADIAGPTPADMVPAQISQDIKTNESILGPGDTVDIEVYRHDDLKRTLRIDAEGKITFPLIGDVEAAGISAVQLRSKMRDELAKYIVDPQVIVNIRGMKSQRVYVLGEVTKPGVFSLEAPMSVLEAVSHSGGFTIDAKEENVIVIRGSRAKAQLVKLDLEKVLEEGDITQDIQLRGGDVVYVPSTIIADVSRFAVYLKNILAPVLMIEQGIILGDQATKIVTGRDQDPTTNLNIILP